MATTYKSKQTVKKGRMVHNVALPYTKGSRGSTSCGTEIAPKDVPKAGLVTCRYCKNHMDGTWLRRMAKLEEGCDVAAGGSLVKRI